MTSNTWPDPARPGVPFNPEKDGWHFLRMNNGTLKVSLWRADGYWLNPPGHEGLTSPRTTAYWNAYLGPVLLPDEAAALQARADRNAAGFARVDAEAERAKFLHKQEIAALQKRVAELEGALERLARLGAEPYYGNSDGNMIARAALEGKKDE